MPPSSALARVTFAVALAKRVAVVYLVPRPGSHRQAATVLVKVAEKEPVGCLRANVHLDESGRFAPSLTLTMDPELENQNSANKEDSLEIAAKENGRVNASLSSLPADLDAMAPVEPIADGDVIGLPSQNENQDAESSLAIQSSENSQEPAIESNGMADTDEQEATQPDFNSTNAGIDQNLSYVNDEYMQSETEDDADGAANVGDKVPDNVAAAELIEPENIMLPPSRTISTSTMQVSDDEADNVISQPITVSGGLQITSNLSQWINKRYHGGYKHKKTKKEFFNAYSQTVTAQEKRALVSNC